MQSTSAAPLALIVKVLPPDFVLTRAPCPSDTAADAVVATRAIGWNRLFARL